MSPAILLGAGGLQGWNLLKRTADRQKQMLAAEPEVARKTQYFRNQIGKTGQAGALVSDYRLMTVALGAYGLEGDIGNRAFIRKVLDSPRSSESSLVNRLSDKRYLRLATAFGYDKGDQMVSSPGFGDRVSVRGAGVISSPPAV